MSARTFFRWIALASLMMVVMAVAFAGIEYAAMRANLAQGNAQPFLFDSTQTKTLDTLQQAAMFQALDPLLGCAHSAAEVQRLLDIPHTRLPGFVVYRAPGEALQRPIIVTLGGSTTDPVQYSHISASWPQQLAESLAADGLDATVINGGVGGYSSSQELIKFVRDVLELDPDIVVGYHGINDVDVSWAQLPTPMIHIYNKQVFGRFIDSEFQYPLKVLPNTMSFALRQLQREKKTNLTEIVYGIETSKSASGFFLRNVDLMRAMAGSRRIDYLSMLQPVGPVSKDSRDAWNVPEPYAAKIRSMWSESIPEVRLRDYMYDLSELLDGKEGVYLEDGIHLTSAGNRIVAAAIRRILEKDADCCAARDTGSATSRGVSLVRMAGG